MVEKEEEERDDVLTESPNFMNMGLSYVHTFYELGSVFIPTNIIGRPTYVLNWLLPGHIISEVTVDRVSTKSSEQNYSAKSDFETRRRGVVNQDYMSRPTLELTPLGTNMTNGKMSPIDSITVGKKMPLPTPQTQPTDSPTIPTYFTEQNEKSHVTGDPDRDPSSSYSSSKKYNSSNEANSIKSNKNKRDKKKKCQKDKKQDFSDSSSIDSDSSEENNYRDKRRKNKSHQKKDPIKLCAHLTANLMMTAYKSKIVRFKLDEDLLQRQIYFSHL